MNKGEMKRLGDYLCKIAERISLIYKQSVLMTKEIRSTI